MLVQVGILMTRAYALSGALQTATLAALQMLRRRGLQYVGINHIREALIAADYGQHVGSLGKIAEVLFGP